MARLVDVGTVDSGQIPLETVHSYDGAHGLYLGAIGRMQLAVGQYAAWTGVFTDELNGKDAASTNSIDTRSGNDTASSALQQTFSGLSQVRGQAQQAIGALQQYPTRTPRAHIGELYAFMGMSEVMLTELFCSGIPLANAPYGADVTLSAAISRTDVLARAVAHFDSALVYGQDSLPIATLARVGKGRALLDLGDFAGAAAAVATVPTAAKYVFTYDAVSQNMVYATVAFGYNKVVTSMEGRNGIDWRAVPDDPRVPLVKASDNVHWSQAKYAMTSPFTLADGIEARLIEAESQLHDKDYAGWMGTLTTLAQSTPGVPLPVDPGAVAGNDSARVSLHFRERAKWLFLTGHRQGDYRRLIRQYNRPAVDVLPTGLYTPAGPAYPVYGLDINIPVPEAERDNNPLYKGCLDRDP
jgi:hypothetical protein